MPPAPGQKAPADDPRQTYKAFIDAFLPTLSNKVHEDRIAYLYLDSSAHLTIGIGHLVAYHKQRNDRKVVRAAVETIFKYGFTNLAPARPVEHGKKTHSVVPGPLGQPKGRPGMDPQVNPGSRATQAAGSDHLLPGPHGTPMPAGATPPTPTLFPPVTVDLLTDEAIKIMALDIHYTKGKSKKKHTYGAPHYQSYNHYALTESGVTSLGFDDVLAKIKEVKSEAAFKQFDTFPESAKQAVIDLAYQHGAGGITWHRDKATKKRVETAFAQAVEKADWNTAADNVPTDSASEARTKWRRDQLRAAVPAAKPGLPGAPKPPTPAPVPAH